MRVLGQSLGARLTLAVFAALGFFLGAVAEVIWFVTMLLSKTNPVVAVGLVVVLLLFFVVPGVLMDWLDKERRGKGDGMQSKPERYRWTKWDKLALGLGLLSWPVFQVFRHRGLDRYLETLAWI